MTIIEMHTQCDLLLDKANSPWFSPEEKDRFINIAQMEFVETRYRQFELDERTRKELLPLVRRYTSSNSKQIDYSVVPKYLFTLSLSGEFTNVCEKGTDWFKISPIQIDDEFETQKDPFNKATNDNPLYVEENNGISNILIVKSDTNPINLLLKYLKYPVQVFLDINNSANNINSELPEFIHDEIVNIAVRKMLGSTEQQMNYQIQSNEINNEN